MNRMINAKVIKKTANAITDLKDVLDVQTKTAIALANKYKDWKGEEESVTKYLEDAKAMLEEVSSTSCLDEVLNEEFYKNYSHASKLIANIQVLDSKIELVGKAIDDIKRSVSDKNKETAKIKAEINKNRDTELVEAAHTINEFVDSDLFKEADEAMDLLNGIIREVNADDPEAILDGSPDPTKLKARIMEREAQTSMDTHEDRRVLEICEKCPMIRKKSETGELDEDACETCQYADTCELLNCEGECDGCIYSDVCLLCEPVSDEEDTDEDIDNESSDDSSSSNDCEVEHAESYDEDDQPLFDEDGKMIETYIDQTDEETIEKEEELTNDIEEDSMYAGMSSPSNQLSYCADSALYNIEHIYKKVSYIANNRDKLTNDETKFFKDMDTFKSAVSKFLKNDEDSLESLSNFYSDIYSSKIDDMLGDGELDEDRININQDNNDTYDSIGAIGICNAVDELTNDLCDDSPECNSFMFNLEGDLKVVTMEGFEKVADTLKEFHSEAIDFISEHKEELADVLYATNFKAFAEYDINDCLQSSGLGYGFNDGDYYTLPIPAPIIDKYTGLFCGSDSVTGQNALTLVKMIINVLNRFNFNVDESCVLKYLRAHTMSSMSVESVLYRTDLYNETFADGEKPCNDAIGTTMELGIGYSQTQLVHIIKSELANKIEAFNDIDDDRTNKFDDTMILKDEIATLVYQIWFNQICKVLFNNDNYTVKDSDLVDGSMALIIDSQPITQFQKCMTSHFRPIDVLVGVNFIYTLELLAENRTVAWEYNLTHTLGCILALNNDFSIGNNVYGQRLDIDVVYKIWTAYIEQAKTAQLKKLEDEAEDNDDIESDEN